MVRPRRQIGPGGANGGRSFYFGGAPEQNADHPSHGASICSLRTSVSSGWGKALRAPRRGHRHDGVFGYRTSAREFGDSPTFDADVAAATEVAEAPMWLTFREDFATRLGTFLVKSGPPRRPKSGPHKEDKSQDSLLSPFFRFIFLMAL